MTVKQLRQVPTVDLESAAQVLGIGRTIAYAMAIRSTDPERAKYRRLGEPFPCRIVKVGRHYCVPTPGLLELLGVPEE